MFSIVAQARKWPLGQVVKTSPSHGGITGSSPVGVTNIAYNLDGCRLFVFTGLKMGLIIFLCICF